MTSTHNIKLFAFLIFTMLSGICSHAKATNWQTDGLTIFSLRFVVNYESMTLNNTVWLSLATPLAWPAGYLRLSGSRVMIDAAKRNHLIAAAVLAHSTKRKVNINADDNLPIRDGACEVTFIDVPA